MQTRLSFASVLLLTASSACLAPAQQLSQTGVLLSDRDKAGLRGPLKTVLEKQTFSGADGKQQFTTTTTQYAPDGRILENRTKTPDVSGWGTSYTYYPDGRLRKTASGDANSAPSSETTYLYDGAQRPVGVKSRDDVRVRYQYDDKGRKSVIETYELKPLPPNTAYAPHWEGTDLGFATHLGGTVTTWFNEQGVATGAEFRNLEGKLQGHIVRKFDEEGRIVAEQQFADAPHDFGLPELPEEIRSKLNPEQLKAMGAAVGAFATSAENRANSYSYDAQGHVTERHRSGGVFGDEVTITKYNDHGDVASELTTTIMNPDVGRVYSVTEAGAMLPEGPPPPAQPPTVFETQYSYQYDGYGNWTELTTASRTDPGAPLASGSVRRRKLTYY
jgi:YD repeat-containing protein